MKTNHTDITIVLDRSGSMQSIASDTIGGFNKFLSDQKAVPGTATLTLNQFDETHERVVNAADIQSVEPLTDKTFVPRGMTALLDAIGRAITDTGMRLAGLSEDRRPEKVVMVIITDGAENASHEYTRRKINEMISHQRDSYAWEFVFLGANQDAITVARSYGISGMNTMRYAGNAIGTASAFSSVSENTSKFRSSSKSSMSFEPKDYAKQDEAGVKK